MFATKTFEELFNYDICLDLNAFNLPIAYHEYYRAVLAHYARNVFAGQVQVIKIR